MIQQTNRDANSMKAGYIYRTNSHGIEYYVVHRVEDRIVYGTSYMPDGENWKWAGHLLQEGEVVTCIGKIKDHPEYLI